MRHGFVWSFFFLVSIALLPLASCSGVFSNSKSSSVSVTGVTLDSSAVMISAEKTQQLTATVTPSTASNKNLAWSSSDSTIATVSSTGLVTGVKAGQATITATTKDGGYSATCVVTVVNADGTTSLSVVVLDSVTGSMVSGATVTAKDSAGNQAAASKTDVDGAATLSALSAGSSYTITATAAGRAAGAMQDYVVGSSSSVNLYCYTLGISAVGATAPVISSIKYSTDGTSYNDFSNGTSISSSLSIKSVEATVYGVVAVQETSFSGFGINIDFDKMPTISKGFSSVRSYTTTASRITDTTDSHYGLFKTVAVFDLSSMSFVSGSHTLELVSYDVANNRVEKHVSFTLSSTSGSGSTLSGYSFSDMLLQLGSYGRNNETFGIARTLKPKALTSTTTGSTSYYSIVEFSLGSVSSGRTNYASILGYDVYRSTDSSSWTKIARVNLDALKSANALYYYDYDSSLTTGVTYYYKVKAFSSSSNYSSDSPILSSSFLAPFTISLASPAWSATATPVASISTPLTFTISDTSLWSSSDKFYFSLFIKKETDSNSSPAFYGEFRYDFSTGGFQAPGSYTTAGAADWTVATPKTVAGISYSSGTISIDMSKACVSAYADGTYYTAPSTLSLVSGATYEWDIYGRFFPSDGSLGDISAMDSAFFLKNGTVSSGSSNAAQSVSYSNTYANGEGSLNGSFLFTVQ
jgi:hypothetical protein